eukprot:gene35091-44531_t
MCGLRTTSAGVFSSFVHPVLQYWPPGLRPPAGSPELRRPPATGATANPSMEWEHPSSVWGPAEVGGTPHNAPLMVGTAAPPTMPPLWWDDAADGVRVVLTPHGCVRGEGARCRHTGVIAGRTADAVI